MTNPGSETQTPLASASVSLVSGALAHDGVLDVTPTSLRFRPTGALDRQLGARSVVLSRADITGVTASPDGRFLAVQVGSTAHRFSGAGLQAVHRALTQTQPASPAPVAQVQETTLVDGVVDFQVATSAWRVGRASLTSKKLVVAPIAHHRGGSAAAAVSLRPSDLVNLDLDDALVLHLHEPGRTLRLRGAPVAAIADRIRQVLAGDHGEPVEDPVLHRGRAGWWRGPVVHWGELTLSERGLRFDPTGLLVTLIGIRPFVVDWCDVRQLSQPNPNERVLDLTTTRGRIQIELAEGMATQVLRLRHHAQVRRALDLTAMNTWARRILDDWKGRIADLADAPLLVAPALHESNAGTRSGLVALTGPSVVFLPEDASDDAGFASWPVERVHRAYAADTDFPSCLRFEARGAAVRILQALGEPFLQAFWSRCRAPARVVEWGELSARTRSRLTGSSDFVRVSVGTTRVERSPGITFEHPRGWAMVVQGSAADAPRRPSRATIEVGQTEGVYQFDARLLDVGPLPPRFREAVGGAGYLLIFDRRGQVRVFNQRQGLRVLTALSGTLQVATDLLPGGSRSSPCTIRDVSIGGCRIEGQLSLSPGDRARVTFTLQGRRISADAVVVRSWLRGDGVCLALRFSKLRSADEDRIHRFVMEQQRRALRDGGVPQDDGPGGGGIPEAVAP